MPVVLKPEGWPAWLGEEPADAPRLKALLAPYPSEEMVAWPVSPRVGNVKNNDASMRIGRVGGAWPSWAHAASASITMSAASHL